MRSSKNVAVVEISVLALILLFFHLHFLGQIHDGNKKLEEIKARTAASSLPVEVREAQDIDPARLALERKANFMTLVFGGRVYWTPKLAEIARAVSDDVVLDVLEISDTQTKETDFAKSLRLQGHLNRGGDDLVMVNQFVDALRASPAVTQGLGSLKISKLRKIMDANGNHTASIFFVDSETGAKAL